MNWKSTLALVLLAGAAGAWFFWGDSLAPKVGLTPAHPEPPPSAAVSTLDALDPAAISRVEVVFPSGDPLVIERPAGETEWTMPGNWPLRKPEVDELVRTLGHLRTRFHAVPLPEGANPADYGLAPDQKPVVVKLTADGQAVTLTFGEPKAAAGETAFTRPAYVRVDDKPEVLRLGPDVMPVVSRPADSYRRRQLFPDAERVKVAGAGPAPSPFGPPAGDAPVTVSLPGEDTESVTVRGPAPRFFGFDLSPLWTFTLIRTGKLPEPGVTTKGGEPALPTDRLADAWVLSAPASDHAEPTRLRAVLAAVADLWVEQFVSVDATKIGAGLPVPIEPLLAAAVRANIDDDTRLGFTDRESRAVTVKRRGAGPVTVRIGGVAKTAERDETISVPAGPPGSPPRTITRKVPVEYRYARVEGNPQVFVVAAEKLSDLFVPAGEMVDPRVARFEADEVREVTIGEGPAALRLTRKKGNPKADKPEEQQDRWFLDAKPNPLLADAARVNELLDKLTGLRADRADRRTYPQTPPAGRTRVTVVAREKRAEDEPDAPERRYTLVIGTPDAVNRLLPVRLDGSSRVSLVGDTTGPGDPDSWVGSLLFPETVSGLLERPAIAYRSRKLLDTAGSTLEGVTVAAGFALRREGGDWKLTAPLSSEADPAAAAKLADAVGGLTATDYLSAAPTAEELAAFGLDKPRQAVALAFSGGRTYTLELGATRPGKPEVFARLDRGAVFGLPSAAADQFTTGAVGLLPLKVWAAQPEKIVSLEIARTGDAAKDGFTLTPDGTNWKLTGPFTAPVPFLNAQPMLATLGNLTAVRYQSLSSANDAEYGLDKPLLRVRLAFREKKPGATGETAVTKTLVVGGAAPDGSRYAKLDAPNAPVFLVPPAFVSAATTPPLELPDRSLLLLDPARVTKVRVAAGDKPQDAFTLAKDAAGKWAAEGVGFAVDAERILNLTATAARPPVGRLAAYGDAIKWAGFGLEKPAETVTVTLAGDKPETHTIALGNPDPTGGQFARIDDKPAVAVIPAAAAEGLTRRKFEYADRTLLTFDPATLAGLTRTAGKDALELAPAAAVGWDVVKPAKHKADAVFVEELAESLGRLRAERVAAYGKKDEVFKQYGLEPPAAAVSVTVGDKAERKTLRVGNPVDPAKPTGERYAAVEGAGAEAIVGVLSGALANKLLAPAVAFRDRSLAKFVDADKAVLERGDRKITFAKVGVAWKVTEPVMTAAESADLEALVADLGKLRADTWVAEKGKDLKPFGLEKPEARWTLSDGDRPVLVLLVGRREADGRVYATTDKTELVGLLDPAMSNRVLAEYRARKAWDVDAAQVDSVEVSRGTAKFALEKAGPQWVDPAKPGDPIDARVVNELLGTLGGLRAERYAADKDADPKLYGLEKPEASVTVSGRGGAARKTLEVGGAVGGTDGKQRYARVADRDRTDVFILSEADTARLLRDRAAYSPKK